MKACGVSVDKDSINQFFKNMADTNAVDAIAAGSKKTVTMPSGGGRAAAASGGAAAAEAEVKEEKKEETADVEMGNLFGGDDDDY